MNPKWSIAFRKRPTGLPSDLPFEAFTAITAPPGECYADPFIYETRGRTFLFFEHFDQRDYFSGHILCTEIRGNRFETPVLALRQPFHLSYPQVFSVNGTIYMLPETRQCGKVLVYRARKFPGDWEIAHVVRSDIEAVDATICIQPSALFILAWTYSPNSSPRLIGLRANSLLGEWTDWHLNGDFLACRPAGSFFHHGENLYRPVQRDKRTYGDWLGVSKVDRLSADHFSERLFGEIRFQGGPSNSSLHTYNRSSNYEAVDYWTSA
jgi:hypothetical protein